jgi:hypothetical protein
MLARPLVSPSRVPQPALFVGSSAPASPPVPDAPPAPAPASPPAPAAPPAPPPATTPVPAGGTPPVPDARLPALASAPPVPALALAPLVPASAPPMPAFALPAPPDPTLPGASSAPPEGPQATSTRAPATQPPRIRALRDPALCASNSERCDRVDPRFAAKCFMAPLVSARWLHHTSALAARVRLRHAIEPFSTGTSTDPRRARATRRARRARGERRICIVRRSRRKRFRGSRDGTGVASMSGRRLQWLATKQPSTASCSRGSVPFHGSPGSWARVRRLACSE